MPRTYEINAILALRKAFYEALEKEIENGAPISEEAIATYVQAAVTLKIASEPLTVIKGEF
jgi:hypothetical protein